MKRAVRGKWKAMSEKKEKFIIFALAGILLLIVCLPVKRENGMAAGAYTETGVVGAGTVQEMNGNGLGEGQMGSISLENKVSGNIAAAAEKNGGIAGTGADTADGYVEVMEKELEELLSCMEGAGKVKVMITLQSTGEDIVEKDRPATRSNRTENDGAGGSRNTNDMDSGETTVFITDAEGRQIPYVRKTMQPSVEGVAVMAQGGGNEAVRRNISEAIQALFGIDANKIKIAKMKTSK